jgi:hypothetical protein
MSVRVDLLVSTTYHNPGPSVAVVEQYSLVVRYTSPCVPRSAQRLAESWELVLVSAEEQIPGSVATVDFCLAKLIPD